MAFTIEVGGSKEHGPCECCGSTSRTVWGYLWAGEVPAAAYFVRWTPGRLDHGAGVDLVVGRWGNGTSAADRVVVAVEYQVMEGKPGFMVVDGQLEGFAALAGAALRREEVVGTARAGEVFGMLDAVWVGDDRIGELAV